MEYIPDKKEIVLNRELSNLDKFVLNFIGVLGKHVDYVIISGYVSILLGRSRITEDVDVFIKKIPRKTLSELYRDLKKSGFWCLNAENVDDMYYFLTNKMAIRFSKKGNFVPNFEVKFPKDKTDEETFKDFVTVILPHGKKLKLSSLERHIAFKRHYLGSGKDAEDALHIEKLFEKYINHEKINKLKKLIRIKKDEEKKNFFKAGKEQ